MKNAILAIVVTLCAPAFAQTPGLKAGLWEITPIRQVVDGRDMTAQMSAAQAKMQQAMAGMSADQRKQMEAMVNGKGMSAPSGAGGGTRICISAAMAARNKPMVDPEGHCEPAKLNRAGNKTSFEFNCSANGRTQVGKGESTVSGDTVTTSMDMTMTDPRGRHTMQSESQMKYLGADCQGIKPIDQLAQEGKAPTR